MARARSRQVDDGQGKVEVIEPQQPETLVAAYSAEVFLGPLPPPKILAQYERVCPGAASRIIAMAEHQATHRQALEKSVIEANCRAQDRGPILGFVLAAMVIAIGATCLWFGKDLAGLTALIAALAAIVIPFLHGKRKQELELASKRRRSEQRTPDEPMSDPD